jgi:hypothetical protein
MNTRTLILAALILTVSNCSGQQKSEVIGLQNKYIAVNRTVSPGTEVGSVHLNEAEGSGIAWIKGEHFSYGVIEFDVKGKDVMQQSFVGFAFHGLNDTTYEAVYFRPFNFRSADHARKAHAVQYIANPKYDWPKLRADFPNKYEQPVYPSPDPNDWFHVRITVEKNKVSVYVNMNNEPSLVVFPLVPLLGEQIGYWVGNGSAGDWRNVLIKQNK